MGNQLLGQLANKLSRALGWICRITSWCVVAGVAYCLITNYQGVVVRGQIQRLSFGPEWEEAADWLLDSTHRNKTDIGRWRTGRWLTSQDPTLTHNLIPQVALSQLELITDDGIVKQIAVFCFDAQGQPRWGNLDLKFKQLVDGGYFSYMVAPIESNGEHFIETRGYLSFELLSQRSQTFHLRSIYHLGPEDCEFVLCLKIKNENWWAPQLVPLEGDHLGFQVQYHQYIRGRPDKIVDGPVFIWDRESRRFDIPPQDTSANWEASRENLVFE